MKMPKTIYMRDDYDDGIEMTDDRDPEGYKYALYSEASLCDGAILALCQRLQAAAIKCDDYHVFVSYAPHVDSLSVIVRDKNHDYGADVAIWPGPILGGYIDLDDNDALTKLTSAIDQLQRLGVDV